MCVVVWTLHAYRSVRMQWTLKIYVCLLHNIDIIHFTLPCSLPLQKNFSMSFRSMCHVCFMCLCMCVCVYAFVDWKLNLTFDGTELSFLLIEVYGFIFEITLLFVSSDCLTLFINFKKNELNKECKGGVFYENFSSI